MKNNALTLTELLITSVIVAVILLGVVSLDALVGKRRQVTSVENLLTLSSRTSVNHILRSVVQAVGYGVSDRKGILIGDEVGDPLTENSGSFCVEQDFAVNSKEYNLTTLEPSDDRWVCYTLNPSDHQIRTCQQRYDAEAPYRGAGRCAFGEVVGKAVAWAPKFEIEMGEVGNTKLMFTISLTDRYDVLRPKSSSNPEKTITISSSVPGHAL